MEVGKMDLKTAIELLDDNYTLGLSRNQREKDALTAVLDAARTQVAMCGFVKAMNSTPDDDLFVQMTRNKAETLKR